MSPQGSYWTRPGRCPNNGRAENENHDQEGGKVKQRLLRIAFHLSLPNQEADRQGYKGSPSELPPLTLPAAGFPPAPLQPPARRRLQSQGQITPNRFNSCRPLTSQKVSKILEDNRLGHLNPDQDNSGGVGGHAMTDSLAALSVPSRALRDTHRRHGPSRSSRDEERYLHSKGWQTRPGPAPPLRGALGVPALRLRP